MEVIDDFDSGIFSEVIKWKSDFNGLKREIGNSMHNSFQEDVVFIF